MYKIIGADKKEYGPVSADQLHQWISEGRANAQSLVQAVGSGEWKPLSAIPEFAEMLRLQAEPSTPPPVSAGGFAATTPEEILARQPELKIGACLSQSWNLLAENFGLLFASSLLIWLISTACRMNMVTGLAYWVFQGVFYGGLYLVFLKRMRGESASVGDTFSGFGVAFAQLLLAGFITSFLGILGLFFCLLPGIYLLVAWTFCVPLVADKRMEFWSAMELSRKTVARIWFAVFALLLLAFLPSILFSLFVQIKIGFAMYVSMVEAMKHGRPTPEEVRAMAMQITTANLPLLWISRFILLLNLPFALGALMHGYENLFGPRKS